MYARRTPQVALLEGLNFDLVVHSPYRALQGLIQVGWHNQAGHAETHSCNTSRGGRSCTTRSWQAAAPPCGVHLFPLHDSTRPTHIVTPIPWLSLPVFPQELKDARAAAAADPSAASSPSSPPGQTPPPGSGPSGGGGYPPLDESLAAAPEALPVEACRRGVGALDALLLSDAPLLYGPAQLAAAALRSGFKARGVRVGGLVRGWQVWVRAENWKGSRGCVAAARRGACGWTLSYAACVVGARTWARSRGWEESDIPGWGCGIRDDVGRISCAWRRLG